MSLHVIDVTDNGTLCALARGETVKYEESIHYPQQIIMTEFA